MRRKRTRRKKIRRRKRNRFPKRNLFTGSIGAIIYYFGHPYQGKEPQT